MFLFVPAPVTPERGASSTLLAQSRGSWGPAIPSPASPPAGSVGGTWRPWWRTDCTAQLALVRAAPGSQRGLAPVWPAKPRLGRVSQAWKGSQSKFVPPGYWHSLARRASRVPLPGSQQAFCNICSQSQTRQQILDNRVQQHSARCLLVWPSLSLNKPALGKYLGELLLLSWVSVVSALFKCKNVIKRALKSKAMPGRALVAKGCEVCTRDTEWGGKHSNAAVCPRTTAGTSPCFPSVCFAASPLNFLHHPGCFPELWLSGPVRSLKSSPVPLNARALNRVAVGRAVCYLSHQAPQLGRMEKRYRLNQHAAWQVRELLRSTRWGKKNKRRILAALNVLELGSAHTTALTNLLGTAGIPGLLPGGNAQHYILHLSKQNDLRGAGGGDPPNGKGQAPEQILRLAGDFLGIADSPAEAGQLSLPLPLRRSGEYRRGEMLGAEALIRLKFYRGNWLHAINKNRKYFLFSLRRGTLSNGFILICQALP